MESVHREPLMLPKGVDAVNNLERKIIHEFKDLLCKVSKGHHPDYEFLMQEISLIDLIEDGWLNIDDSLFIIQYYLNNAK